MDTFIPKESHFKSLTLILIFTPIPVTPTLVSIPTLIQTLTPVLAPRMV